MMMSKLNQSPRKGLSIMEVLFAIGVLMIGLLGIASILPVAARNANNALLADLSTAAIENQVSNAAARVTEQLTYLDVPNQSLTAFQPPLGTPYFNGYGPYSGLAPIPLTPPPGPSSPNFGHRQVFRGVGSSYTRIDLTSLIVKETVRGKYAGIRGLNMASLTPGPPTGPSFIDADFFFDPIEAQGISEVLPRPSFCIDPAFLSASGNLRNDVAVSGARTVNGYDRTQFPCYDLNYNPQQSPSLQLASAPFPMTPRMYRVGMPTTAATVPSNVVAKVMLSERDGLPLFRPKGELRGAPPGLLVRPTGATVGPTTAQRSGRYSTMITLVPTSTGGQTYEASIVVFESRKLTINEVGSGPAAEVFNLEPYTASRWDDPTAAANTRTYGEEVLGIVEYAPAPITGGVGQFTYVHSAACNPEIGINDWVMLCRWIPHEGINRFAWYRVSDVISEPTLDPPAPAAPVLYRTAIEVRGGDWLFHPSQVSATGSAGPFQYNPPATGTNIYNRRVTTIVKMPRVVAVRTMTITF